MLSRRHIRTKVLQTLYAWFQSEDPDPGKKEKELFQSMERVRDLYLLLLYMLVELHRQAELRIEERKKRRLPRPEDLNPNLRFVENPILLKLRDSERLQKEWDRHGTEALVPRDLVPTLFKELEESELYRDYMEAGTMEDQGHRKFLVEAFREFVAENERFQLYLEERSIFWVDDLDPVSGNLIRTLQEMPTRPEKEIALPALYRNEESDPAFAKKLFRRTIEQDAENREWIRQNLKNWELERIAFMDMLLLEMAIAEARSFSDIPMKVSINEYIEIAREFSTPKSDRFLNGILDKILGSMKAEGMIEKTGKGLIE